MDLTHEQLLLIMGAIAAIVTAAGPVFTGIGAAVGSWITARRAAKKEEVEYLRTELRSLRADFTVLQEKYEQVVVENLRLKEYMMEIRIILKQHNIDAPTFEEWTTKDNS